MGLFDKEDPPEGPDWEKMMKDIDKYVQQNQGIFQDALKFGKTEIAKNQKFVQAIQKYGMDLSGKLGTKAQKFEDTTAGRIKTLEGMGTRYGAANEDIYGENKKLAGRITDEIMGGVEEQGELGGKLRDRYEKGAVPFEDEYLAKLRGWDTTGRREARAAESVNDVAMASEAARESELRRLEGYGIDPSQTRSAALDSRIQAQNAIAKAAAANQARQQVEQEGLQTGQAAVQIGQQGLVNAGQLTQAASQQGGVAATIAAAPGAQYLEGLGNLANYGQGIAEFERAGGGLAFDMSRMAGGVGTEAMRQAAAQQGATSGYGTDVYGQGSDINRGTAGIINSAYGTANSLNTTDQQAFQHSQENSTMAGIGKLAGIAIPAALGQPWMSTAISGIMNRGGGGGGAAPVQPFQPAPTQAFYNNFDEGGAVDRSLSPSRGAIPDDVPALLGADEYVMDADTVRWHGMKHLKKLQDDAKKGMGIPVAA